MVVALVGSAAADPTSGVDAALWRPSYDTNGIFAVEGARLMPVRDLSFKLFAGYAQAPIDISVPGIGDSSADHILKYAAQFDMTFGMTITDRLAIGFDAAGYRSAVGAGYGTRGLYTDPTVRSTGLISLRPLSNIDPSANPDNGMAFLGDELAGPLDVHAGLKLALYQDPNIALTAIGSVFLPFGEDEMLLGDRGIVYEPKLAFEYRPDRYHATRVVANAAMRIRQRSVLEAYDASNAAMTAADAKVILDVGSEAVAGLGGLVEVSPRLLLGAEAQAFIPLPSSLDYGSCFRFNGAKCGTLTDADYFNGGSRGDFTVLATAGVGIRATGDLTVNVLAGAGFAGDRSEQFQVTAGLVWSPQPEGAASVGRNDKDGDGIPDSVDACPD
ncbi:MAG TPA: hypothetical protein VGC41_29400, partial [Kofleriaceae bacterium]